jgi:hypothetical protein
MKSSLALLRVAIALDERFFSSYQAKETKKWKRERVNKQIKSHTIGVYGTRS